jgi:DMSO/TMAO reductase YedYZ molybdopterin-dependent catalytic subunit
MSMLTRREILRLGVGTATVTLLAACRQRSSKGTTPVSSTVMDLSVPSATEQALIPPQPDEPGLTSGTTPSLSEKPTPEPGPADPFFDYDSDVTITPIEDFYTYTYHPQPPPVLPDYRLRVFGAVRNELNLSLDDLMAMPVMEDMRTLECISNPVGGRLIGNAVWRGLPMAHLLKLAGVLPRAIELKFECGDGYHTSIPVELAMDARSLLAYWMNGVPLPPRHGHPLRALWPGRYGQKQPKWITGIELIAEPHLGHWERQGWSNDAIVVPNSRIDSPEKRDVVELPITVSGIAFANQSGVTHVDVSTDNGAAWHRTELIRGPSTLTWIEWSYEWLDAKPGSYVIRARVTDGNGRVQRLGNQRLLSGVKPDGTDVQHSVAVTVKRSL